MRPRSVLAAGLLGVVMLALGALLVARLLPPDGNDGSVEPVILTPAGVLVPASGETASTPSATTPPPTTTPTVRPPTRTQAPEPVRPTPRDVDDDDDDGDDRSDDDDD